METGDGIEGIEGESWTFSLAAVVMVDEVVVLIPFTTRKGGSWASGRLKLLAVGFKALTTSFMALA